MDRLIEHFKQLAYNNHWSNYRLYGACRQLSDTEFVKQRPSYFGSIAATLNHLVDVDYLYLARLTGETISKNNRTQFESDFKRLKHLQNHVDKALIQFVETQTAQSLESIVYFLRDTGEQYEESISDVLTHIFMHQIHHRGQIHDMLSQTSVAPPQLDEFFLKGDKHLRIKELIELDIPE